MTGCSFVDADEIVTAGAGAGDRRAVRRRRAAARRAISCAGAISLDGRVLRHGLANNKLALFDRRAFVFPVVGDLDLPGMGEIEGHYQPVARFGPA